MKPPDKKATYADLMQVPDTRVAEIVDGQLITSPRPALRHSLAASSLGDELGGPFQKSRGGPGGWWIVDEPELHLEQDVLVPDLVGWRRERVPGIVEAVAMTVAPDWICEVLSPSTESLDRARKMRIYARERVAHAWLVNPIARTLEVYRLETAGWLLLATHSSDAIVRAEPFDAVAIDLLDLWGETRAR